MRVIPTLFALALATPALSIPVPRSLIARSDISHETSHGAGAAPTATEAPPAVVNHAAAAPAPTTSGLVTDPAENERIINDLVSFARGDSSVILRQIKPVANDVSAVVEGMIKGAKIDWIHNFMPGAQATHPPTTTTVTVTETHSATLSTETATSSTDPAAAAPTISSDEEGNSETAPPGVEEERRSLHEKRAEPTCSQIYQSDPGDTCEIIALKFGVSADAVHSANPFLDCNDVWVATSICIPAFTCATMIQTQDGDTCQSIGARYGVQATDIQIANVFLNCNSIAPSTQVCVPPAQSQASQSSGGQWSMGGGSSYNHNAGYGAGYNHNGGHGMNNNHQGGHYEEHYDPQLGMQFAMMGLGMMNPESPQNMPPIPVNSDNIAKLNSYIQHLQLLSTALERVATGASPTPNAAAAAAPTPTTETHSAPATSTTDTAATSTDATSTSTDAAAPTPEEKHVHAKTNPHPAAPAPVVGKTHPWR